ncbi:MAG: fibronectin type III domain-containing protein, partial [Bacteroidia bacterium]|nr:fibronectin type III domain-containing protein [Bacteroidia bacterium]MDW8159612.1 fibronectin type III domain-containing protein [Bacteroidia bacterium]
DNPALFTSPTISTSTRFFVSAANANCESERVEVRATILPQPSMPPVASISICKPGIATFTVETENNEGWEYRLYNNSLLQGAPLATAVYPTTLTTPFITTTTTYWIVASNGACLSQAVQVTASLLSTPVLQPINPINLCGAGTATFTISVPAGTTLRIYDTYNNLLKTEIATTTPYLLVSPMTYNNSTYKIVASSGSCTSNAVEAMVFVSQRPGVPVVMNTNMVICRAQTVSFTVGMGSPSGTEIRLYNATTNQLLATDNQAPFVLSTSVTTNSTFYVTSLHQNSGCESDPVEVFVQVVRVPTEPSARDVTFQCQPANAVIFTANMGNVPGTEMRLYDAQFGGNLVATSTTAPYLLVTPPLAQSSTFWVAAATGNCESPRVAVQANCIQANCEKPRTLAVTNITATSATLLWSHVPNAICYIIKYMRTGTNEVMQSIMVPSPNTTFTLSNLQVNSDYFVTLQTNCSSCRENTGQISSDFAAANFRTGAFRLNVFSEQDSNLIILYPNPNSGAFQLGGLKGGKNYKLTLQDLSGRRLLMQEIPALQNSDEHGLFEIKFDWTQNLEPGIYLLVVSSQNQEWQMKLIIR